MSHLVIIKAQIKDSHALAAACTRLGLSQPTQGQAQLFASEASGYIVQLPGWQYPAVFDTMSGEAKFDTYNGAWGEQKELDKLLQAYAVEKTRLECRKAGNTLTEQSLADGSIKLAISVGGAI